MTSIEKQMGAILAAMVPTALMLMALLRVGIWFIAWAVTTIPETYIVGFTLNLVSTILFVVAVAGLSDALMRMGRKYWKLSKSKKG